MESLTVRVLLTIHCTDPEARVAQTLLQADLSLPTLLPNLALSIFERVYPAEQIVYVVEKSRYQLSLQTVEVSSWKGCLKQVEELMHAGFKVKIFPVLHETEEQAKSAIFANDLSGNRLTTMRINGQWHTLREDEKFWIKFRSEAVIFVPVPREEETAHISDVHRRGEEMYQTTDSLQVT